ncbi:UreF-domain-containing protein [Xylariaceae sp. FL0662B]|nr:UreF-domain-containing protein [Xylariaceae sp. FL0662B]
MNPATRDDSQEDLENEIADLEQRLTRAKQRLKEKTTGSHQHPSSTHLLPQTPSAQPPSHHDLLLLSDSALPLGSFAFSSGLESYLAHTRRSGISRPSSFSAFLPLSLSAHASTTLPFLLAAHRDPSASTIAALDDALDATIVCAVGRRASVAQGRALLSIWEKSLAGTIPTTAPDAREALRPLAALLRSGGAGGEGEDGVALFSAHLAPLFGAVANLCGLSRRQTAYVYMLGHVKALVSAGVRAGLFGPYQAQRVLAGPQVRDLLAAVIESRWRTPVEEAGQTVPVVDLWVGRHEVLYSRIFNS